MIDAPAHSDCGPSSLSRRMKCPGSRNAERGLPDRVSKDAAEGTVFHEVAAMCLEFGLEPDDFLDREFEADGYTFTFDEDFARHMRPGLDRVAEMLSDCDVFGFETRVDISAFTEPGQFGTTDVWGISRRKRIIKIHDWKYGEGVGVVAEENVQAVAYALGIWDDIGWKVLGNADDVTVEIVIDQMRRPNSGGRWVVPLARCFLIAEEIKKAVERTNDPNAPRIPGIEQCFFCKAKGRCAELAAFNLKLMGMKFEDLSGDGELRPPEVRDMTPDEIAQVIINRPLWSAWHQAVHEFALGQIMAGKELPGLKAVPGRAGHRIWTDEGKVEHMLKRVLGDKAFARKLVSPAQAEKLLGKEDAEDLSIWWTQRQNKPSLVSVEDDREPLPSNASKFDNLGDE